MLQPLDEVRHALSGAWDMGRAGFWWRAAEAAATHRDWDLATNRLLHLADPLDDTPSGAVAWRQLAVAAFDTAVRARSAELVAAVASQLLDRAFEPDAPLDELVGVFRTAEELGAAAQGRALGLILQRRYPRSAWASYAAAHFDELEARLASEPAELPDRLAGRFERAAQLFEAAGNSEHAKHARLRSAVVRMTWTSQSGKARKAVVAAGAEAEGPAARRWLAFARAHSPFWLDRVRAADWVGDTLDSSTDAQELRDAHAVADVLFGLLPVRLSEAERDRLSALLDDFDGERRWDLEAQLRGRDAALSESGRVLSELDLGRARQLERDALPLGGFAALVEAWQGGTPEERPRNEVAARVVDVVVAARSPEMLEPLRALGRVVASSADARSLRPVPLALIRACAAGPDDPEVDAALTEIALHYAHRAPTPSHGFLAIARLLFDGGLHRAAAAATLRAIDGGERAEGIELCVARSVQWAVREGSDREMLEWLEVGERAFAL